MRSLGLALGAVLAAGVTMGGPLALAANSSLPQPVTQINELDLLPRAA